MPDSYEAVPDEKMTHQEIVERFRKVFGREMTALERRSFFLDLQFPKESEPDNS
jgi:hypothetical protein